MQSIKRFLNDLWWNTKETDIYLTLYSMWSSPASSISRQAGFERVYTYKALQKMVDTGIVATTKKSGTLHFWIPDENLLLTYIEKQRNSRQELAQRYPQVSNELQELRNTAQAQAPKIQLFEWKQQVTNLFTDIQNTILSQELLALIVFGTHTFQEQIVSHDTVTTFAGDLASFLTEHNIAITNYIAEGGLIMEQIRQYPWIERLWDLPAGDNAINIFVVWQVVYVVIYKGQPVWLKISSPEFARALHFVLRQTEK